MEELNVLVTGATGFVGRALMDTFRRKEITATGTSRKAFSDYKIVGEVDKNTDWREALSGCNAVVHLAARVHIMDEKSADPLAEFRIANVDGTIALARQAAEAGVKRFIFISSVKVNGEQTHETPFHAEDVPNPQDPYAISKYEAENALKEMCNNSEMEYVIIRPPLIYGADVKANFLRLIQAVDKGLPLPFGRITKNARSLLFIENLTDFILNTLTHTRAANETFMVSDGHDLSTFDLIQTLTKVMNKRSYLIPVPVKILRLIGKMTGKSDTIARVCDSLTVDIQKNKDFLHWSPPVSVEEGLQQTINAYFMGETGRK